MASYARPRRVRIEGADGSRVVDVPGNFKTISLPLALPRGRSSLVLTTDPQAEPLPDGRRATVYMTNWGFDLPGAGKSEPVAGEPLRPAPAR
jgi:hypothetical protein